MDDIEAARSACRELEQVAARQGTAVLEARSAQATGATSFAQGDPGPR